MDSSRFDALVKFVASRPSRRQVLRTLGGGLLAAAGALGKHKALASPCPRPSHPCGEGCCAAGEVCLDSGCCRRPQVCGGGECCGACQHCVGGPSTGQCQPFPDGVPCPGGHCLVGACCTGTDCGGSCCVGACCSGTCLEGACCPIGAGCTRNGDCCSGFCNESNQCDCLGPGDPCQLGASSCCTGSCSDQGLCCTDLGHACTSNDECCSGRCNSKHGLCDCSTCVSPMSCLNCSGDATCGAFTTAGMCCVFPAAAFCCCPDPLTGEGGQAGCCEPIDGDFSHCVAQCSIFHALGGAINCQDRDCCQGGNANAECPCLPTGHACGPNSICCTGRCPDSETPVCP